MADRNKARQMVIQYGALRARYEEYKARVAALDMQEEAARNPSCVAGWSGMPSANTVGRPTEQAVERLQSIEERRQQIRPMSDEEVALVASVGALLGELRVEHYTYAEAVEMRYIDGLTHEETTAAYNARHPRRAPITNDTMRDRVRFGLDWIAEHTKA